MILVKLYHLIIFLALLLIFGQHVTAHPQCLDLSPPFKSDSNTGFCSRYSTFGCCTSQNETVLVKRYTDIIQHLTPKQLFWGEAKCQNIVEDILCLRCSPYASHMFNVDSTMEQITFPGLCRSFCADFVRLCPELLQYIANNKSVPSTFCENFQVSDTDYCFPEILTNDMVNNQIAIQSVDEPGCICVEEVAEGLNTPLTRMTGRIEYLLEKRTALSEFSIPMAPRFPNRFWTYGRRYWTQKTMETKGVFLVLRFTLDLKKILSFICITLWNYR